VQLTWRDRSSDESGFIVERRVDGGDFEALTTVAANTRAYTDDSADANVSYTYRVVAFNDAGSADSNTESVTMSSSTVSNPVLSPDGPRAWGGYFGGWFRYSRSWR
jgi:titin